MEKYKKIAQDLAQKIESEQYPGGTKLPLESELCEMYQVSRITIKKATDQLVQLGLINKRRGSGSFVKELTNVETATAAINEQVTFTGFTRQFANRKVTSLVNEFKIIPASREVAEKLNLTEEDFVYYICRTRLLDNVPCVVEYTYMPIDVIPGVSLRVLNSSIYEYILNTLHLKPQSAHRSIRALLASPEEQEYFHINKAFPVLEIEQVAYLNDGRIFEYSKSHQHGEKFEFNCVSIW